MRIERGKIGLGIKKRPLMEPNNRKVAKKLANKNRNRRCRPSIKKCCVTGHSQLAELCQQSRGLLLLGWCVWLCNTNSKDKVDSIDT